VLPGALARHRDAMAIAISMLRFGTGGYASVAEITETLDREGMSYGHCKLGLQVFDNEALLNRALRTAAHVAVEDPGRLYFMDAHEKGLSLYYLLCFALFGIRIQSLFYGFVFIMAVSVLAFIGQFRARPSAMVGLLALCLSMVVSVRVIQVLEPDVNAIHSSRYLPLLNVIPVLHLLLAALYREPLRPLSVGLAAVQVCIIDLVLFSRSSGFWLIIAFAMVLGGGWLLGLARRRFANTAVEAPRWWPAGCLAAGLALLSAHTTYGLHPHYYGDEGKSTRTSWHHFLVAAHYNAERTALFGVPANFPFYGDEVCYFLFEEELKRRGEPLESYLHPDADTWPLRTTDRRYDYCWNKYDTVVRDLFFRLLREQPLYVLTSVLQNEPLAVLEQLFGHETRATAQHEQIGPRNSRQFFNRALVLDWKLVLLLVTGTVLARRELVRVRLKPLALAGTVACLVSFLPALASGVMPLRLVEPAFLLVAALYFLGACLLAHALTALTRRQESLSHAGSAATADPVVAAG
jgi:hypothetical protein